MIGGTQAFSPASSAFLLETTDANANNSIRSSCSSSSLRKSLNFNPRISCSASSSSSNRGYGIPKLEPFSKSRLERALKEPSLIEKTEQELSDYCSVLEVEDAYDCWEAYFDLKYLEEEAPKTDVESLIVQAAEGGLKSVISWVHRIASIYKARKNEGAKGETKEGAKRETKEVEDVVNGERRIPRHIPDGIPRPLEEMEEEEKERMPDSPHTRLLRVMGKYPAWYTPPPDHASAFWG